MDLLAMADPCEVERLVASSDRGKVEQPAGEENKKSDRAADHRADRAPLGKLVCADEGSEEKARGTSRRNHENNVGRTENRTDIGHIRNRFW